MWHPYCDLVTLRVRDIALGMNIQSRAKIIQQKTGRPVQFEITEQTRVAIKALIQKDALDNSTIFSNLVSGILRIYLRGNIAEL